MTTYKTKLKKQRMKKKLFDKRVEGTYNRFSRKQTKKVNKLL